MGGIRKRKDESEKEFLDRKARDLKERSLQLENKNKNNSPKSTEDDEPKLEHEPVAAFTHDEKEDIAKFLANLQDGLADDENDEMPPPPPKLVRQNGRYASASQLPEVKEKKSKPKPTKPPKPITPPVSESDDEDEDVSDIDDDVDVEVDEEEVKQVLAPPKKEVAAKKVKEVKIKEPKPKKIKEIKPKKAAKPKESVLEDVEEPKKNIKLHLYNKPKQGGKLMLDNEAYVLPYDHVAFG